jgi:hypothetical protein
MAARFFKLTGFGVVCGMPEAPGSTWGAGEKRADPNLGLVLKSFLEKLDL